MDEMIPRHRIPFAAFVLLAFPLTLAAPGTLRAESWFDMDVDYRMWGTGVSSFEVSPEGDENWEPGTTIINRLRAGLHGGWAAMSLHLEGDLFYGAAAGVFPDIAPGATVFPPHDIITSDSFVPRKGYLELKTPVGMFRMGHQTSSWGQGILANSGEEKPMEMFSHRWRGDLVDRALFATRPLKLFLDSPVADRVILVGAFDVVYRDENADLVDGDFATQYIGSLSYRGETGDIGAYVVYRDQTDANDEFLRVLAVDLAGTLALPIFPGGTLRTAAEVAWITGETDRSRPWNSPSGVDVNALGFASEVAVVLDSSQLSLGFKGGYAAGDGDLDDGTLYRFRFDPDYNVGLILFDHYLAGMTAASIERARDPENAAEPPHGLTGLATNGSLENTVYLAPTLVYGGETGPAAAVMAVFAWSDRGVPSAYETFAGGGDPHGYLGSPTKPLQSLGIEFDVAVRYRYRLMEAITFEARAEGGVLRPGAAFRNEEGEKPGEVTLLQGTLGVRW